MVACILFYVEPSACYQFMVWLLHTPETLKQLLLSVDHQKSKNTQVVLKVL